MSHTEQEQNFYEPENALLWVSRVPSPQQTYL